MGAIAWGIVVGRRLPKVEWRNQATAWAVAAGIGAGLAAYAEFQAYRHLSVALVVLLLFMSPIWIAVAQRVKYRTQFGLRALVALTLILGGLLIFTGFVGTDASFTGISLALGASIGGALLFIGIHEGTRHHGSLITTAIVIWSSASIVLLLAFANGGPSSATASPSTLGLSVLLGLLTSVLGIALVTGAISRIGPFNTALFATSEPLFAAAIAWAGLGEVLTITQCFGAALMISGILLVDRAHQPSRVG